MSQLASIALATARTLLNDDGQQVWTDVVLMPKLQAAHRELQVQLRSNACPVTRVWIANIIVSPNTITLPNPPSDLIEPIALWEKDTGEPIDKYVRMTEYDPLPVIAPTTRLIYWSWSLETIAFVGSTALRHIKIYYKRMIPVPTVGSESLGIIDAELYVGPRTAAFAFGSTGNTAASDWCTTMAMQSLGEVITANRGRSRMVQKP